MSTRINTVHDDIVSSLNIQVNETLNSFNSVIEEKRKDCENGMIPVGPVYGSFIRNIRKIALSQLSGIKTWLGMHVRSTIIQQVRTSGVYKLHEIKEEISAAKAEKQKALEERKHIYEDNDTLSDFEKYSLYGHPEFEPSTKRNKKKNNHSISTRTITPNVDLAYRKYIAKRKRSLLIGVIVTIICIAVDFSMIYEMFLSANYSPKSAVIIAIISAAMLDAPPYVLGYGWTKSDDDKNLIELQGDADTPEAMRKIKGSKVLLAIMLVVISVVFFVYLVVRILSFFGGGDFNIAFHAIVENDWSKIKNIEFSGADFLSIAVPLATSGVAFGVGIMLYAMRTDYIKESIIVIKNEINEKIRVCESKIVDCEKQINDLEDSMVSLKKEIWTFYLGRKPFPSEDETFRLEVSLAFQKINLSLYKQTYSDCCLLLRNHAKSLLKTVNSRLAQYAANQPNIIAMTLSEEEEDSLDDLWVIPTNGAIQHQTTQEHLTAIEDTINDLLNNLG